MRINRMDNDCFMKCLITETNGITMTKDAPFE